MYEIRFIYKVIYKLGIHVVHVCGCSLSKDLPFHGTRRLHQLNLQTLQIIYRIRRLIFHFKAFNELCSEMKQNQKSNGWSWVKNSLFNAKGPKMLQALRMTICPATVLLFEARICYPALRVTLTTFYLAMNDFIAN